MLIGLATGEGGGERESHSKVGTLLGPTTTSAKYVYIKKITWVHSKMYTVHVQWCVSRSAIK